MSARYFAAINTKEKSHDASEYSIIIYISHILQSKAQRHCLMVECAQVVQWARDRDGKGLSSQALTEPAIALPIEQGWNLTGEQVTLENCSGVVQEKILVTSHLLSCHCLTVAFSCHMNENRTDQLRISYPDMKAIRENPLPRRIKF